MNSPSVPAENAEPSGMREPQLPLTVAQQAFASVLGDALAKAWEMLPRSNACATPPAPTTATKI